ncbi:adenylylsulfatase HINT3 isoform X5 [Quercus robur]|uniref:adenylylsulfatase HINT3 isoform X4 n=1 Tax=Quercus robur TaxID=38942 RepID=UPI002163BF82|nr:adenylylsulfatase HINT3 isoform X4 [Quercus robur]XP_050252464.1 adenylylsulfatase HINT3 isoform X5 [Quercus robur]
MEEAKARRRLSILCSHLRPLGASDSGHAPTHLISSRVSNSDSETENNEKNLHQNDCVFCKIIINESPSVKLYEDDMCLCILDRNPLSHGHSLIIPKSHFCSLEATPPSVVAAMCSKVPFISSAIMKATDSDSFNLVVNNGASAGQVIFHSLRRRRLKLDQDVFKLVDSVREQLSVSNNTKNGLTGN